MSNELVYGFFIPDDGDRTLSKTCSTVTQELLAIYENVSLEDMSLKHIRTLNRNAKKTILKIGKYLDSNVLLSADSIRANEILSDARMRIARVLKQSIDELRVRAYNPGDDGPDALFALLSELTDLLDFVIQTVDNEEDEDGINDVDTSKLSEGARRFL